MDLTDTYTMNNGVKIPRVGLGTFLLEPGGETVDAVRWALEIGYRHIDTASGYRNEESVGRALKESGIDRGEVFVTTKIQTRDQGYRSTLDAFDTSRRLLGLDVVDLYLIHWPGRDRFTDTWRAMEKLHHDGKIRSIGVSNFLVHHLEELAAAGEVVPAVNQVEFHPFLFQKELFDYDNAHHIGHESWSPLTRGRMMNDPVITETARAVERTNAQVMLRWALQHGVLIIPKSKHRERIKENSALFDFELSPGQMTALDALDRGRRIGPHPDKFNL